MMFFLRFSAKYFPYFPIVIFSLCILSGCINECDTSNKTNLSIGFQGADKKQKSLKFQLINEYNVRLDSLEGNEQASSIIFPLDLSKDSTILKFLLYYPDPATETPVEEQIIFKYNLQPFNRGPECGIDVKVTNLTVNHNPDPAKFFDSVRVVNADLMATKVSHVLIYISE